MKRYLVFVAYTSVIGFASAHAQTFPSPSFDNSAEITQTGNQNTAVIDQAVDGFINGQGRAEIIQRSNRGDATITQSSATSPMINQFANTAVIDQRFRDTATISQIHDYNIQQANTATIIQMTPDATATIGQRGDRNTSRIIQRSGSVAPIASIDQNGRINTAIVDQQAGASGQVVIAQGTFDSNPGVSPETFSSRAEVLSAGFNADIYVSQIGFSHDALVTEDGTNGVVSVVMNGVANTVTVLQESQNGFVDVGSTAASFSNVADVVQAASDFGSTARISQAGYFGDAEIRQLDDVGGGGENLADVEQTGLGTGSGDLYSSILQNGGSNIAVVNQASAFAQSGIVQKGVGHLASVSQ
jgi:hypothetical protein